MTFLLRGPSTDLFIETSSIEQARQCVRSGIGKVRFQGNLLLLEPVLRVVQLLLHVFIDRDEPFNNFGDDMQAFVKNNIAEITAISKEIGIIK